MAGRCGDGVKSRAGTLRGTADVASATNGVVGKVKGLISFHSIAIPRASVLTVLNRFSKSFLPMCSYVNKVFC